MGISGSKTCALHEKPFTIPGDPVAKALRYDSVEVMRKEMASKDAFIAGIVSDPSTHSQCATLLGKLDLGKVNMPVSQITEIVDFGDPVRPVSPARVGQLSESLFREGVLDKWVGGGIVVGLRFSPNTEADQGVQLKCIGGHHRVRAAEKFANAAANRDVYGWEGTPWVDDKGDVQNPFENHKTVVTFIYLGQATDALLIDLTVALNHGNDACGPTSFNDRLAIMCRMRSDGMEEKAIRKVFCTLLPENFNTTRQYYGLHHQLSAHPEIVGALGDYFGNVLDTSTKGFFTESKFRMDQTAKDLREELGEPLGNLCFVKFAIYCHGSPRTGLVTGPLSKRVKDDMRRFAATLSVPVKQLRTSLNAAGARKKARYRRQM